MADANRDLLTAVGGRIRERRTRRGWTQEKLCEVAAVRQGTLSKIELGRTDVGLTMLARLASALGCAVGDLADPPREPDVPSSEAIGKLTNLLGERERVAVAALLRELAR